MRNMIGTYLRTLRKQKNYTQEEVAKQIGVKRQLYSHYETGRVRPSLSILRKVASVYDISIEVLIEADNEGMEESLQGEEMLYQLTREEQDLIRLHRQLDKHDQENIIAFTELLARRKHNT